MNDYLTHLVARTFNPTEVIQPRLPGLFEPSPMAVELEPTSDPGRAPMSAPAVFRESESEISMPLSSEADPSQAFQGTPRASENSLSARVPTARPPWSGMRVPGINGDPGPAGAAPGPLRPRSRVSDAGRGSRDEAGAGNRAPSTSFDFAQDRRSGRVGERFQTVSQQPAALTVPQLNRIEEGALHQTRREASQPPTSDQPTLGSLRPARVVRQPPSSAAPDSDNYQILKAEPPINPDSIRPLSLIEPEASSKKPEPFPNSRAELYPAQPTGQLITAPITVPPQVTHGRPVESTESATAEPAIQPASPAVPRRIIAHPRVTPAQRIESTELAAAEPAAAAPPTIHVTIGRVEVRAVLPPPSPARPAAKSAPAPRMSLDDYLRSRTGGAR